MGDVGDSRLLSDVWRLVERLPSIILESDALRKELFPQPLCGGYLQRYYAGAGQGGACGGTLIYKTKQGVMGTWKKR